MEKLLTLCLERFDVISGEGSHPQNNPPGWLHVIHLYLLKMPLSEQQLSGLYWEEKTFGIEPRWTAEPDIDSITSTLQSFWPSKTVTVAFFAQGAFNKLYQVSVEDEPPLLLRLSLPVDPRYKTLSEVATLRWLSAVTTIPVPQIINYDSSRDSSVGFEWILMTKLGGKSLSDAWTRLDFTTKSDIVRQFASFSACLFQNQLSGIGNIYPSPSLTPSTGRIVSMAFFWGKRIHLDIYRGPFRSSKEWIKARLSLSESDCLSLMEKYPDGTGLDSDAEDELEDAMRTLSITSKLRQLLDRVFPNGTNAEEPTMLCHGDLYRSNILVDDAGKLKGVIDWECASALPLWKACSYPLFLEGRRRHEKPDVSRYQRNQDQEPSELYHEHLLEYELTCLRGLFLEEMERLEPQWTAVFKASQVERDFDLAVENCDKRKFPNKIEIVEPDPTWPARYQLLKSRIEAALGAQALSIAHAGSTSVPGLPAKDVVDMDLTVPDPADEGAYVPALEAAGFHFRTREPHWHQHRFFSCYAPAAANLHVFGLGCPEVARHRIFRDWLARCDGDRQLYAQTKRQAAAATVAAGERLAMYNLRKEPVIREILQRAFRDAGYIK
ncbi:hypothetical protein TPAR_01696 [Tolypocladium paradoxum]|uniref:Aminoglycoside phosphotransferase domain-containing protein n=1 Tax=Tolypocladium paradoxum TaxID=94208 RepID=A0A2S4L6N4_9HYPO|nr:hypothetical protein TPAR_01696 [Tolypocladium paradoxum]